MSFHSVFNDITFVAARLQHDAHWQNSKIERHGGILQVMLNKMDLEQGIDSPQQLQEALSQATSTKNQWSRHQGYPPEMLVFGKKHKSPGVRD